MAAEDITLFQMENVVSTKKIVGKGAYGRVIEVSTISAAKELHQSLTDFANPQELARLQQKFLSECQQCSKLFHPNIVQFLGIFYPSKDAKLPWLVMEKMDCSLTEYLNVHQPKEVSFETRISVLHNISLGLQYLHVQDIIHRDLSSNNILLTKQLVAKIADLGVAKVIDPNRTRSHTQAPGTVIFMPPEALWVKPQYGKPVDVFSLGCVMVHIMTHIWPVPKDEVSVDKLTGKKIARGEIERREDYLELVQEPEKLKEVILQCLNDLPDQRPSVGDVSKVFRELKPDLKVEKVYSILFEYEPLLTLKNQLLQELQVEKQAKKEIEQAKKDAEEGNKEREDRIAELEEFINDQVVELDKKEATMKQTVANKQILEKDHKKLTEYYSTAKKLVEDYQSRLITQEERISELNQTITDTSNRIKGLEKENQALTEEVEKLRDQNANEIKNLPRTAEEKELLQCKLELQKAYEELQTKEFMLNVYKEDFEQERKDRENAHNIKEDEIRKVRIEMEKFQEQCQEKIHSIKQAQKTELQSYKEHASHYSKENEKHKRECARLRAELDKERKDAQGKSDVYKKKTEQFQVQWKRRKEAEARVHVLTEQLNAQCELNKQLSSTIDSWQRKQKGIEPQIPSNNMANQQLQGQQRQGSRNLLISNVSTPMDTPSDQYRTSAAMSKPHYDPSVAHTNAGMPYQNQLPSSSTGQQGWQRQQEQQRIHSMQQQQQQEQLHMRGQGRGSSHNQPSYYQPDYQGKAHLPPANNDNHQTRSTQPAYNVAGTEAINEEIRYQADRQRRHQEYERFDSTPQLDPYLICPKCQLQFREGQLPEYRHHIDNCQQ